MQRLGARWSIITAALVAILGMSSAAFADGYPPVNVAISNSGFEAQDLSSAMWSMGTPGWQLLAGTAGALGGGLYGTGAWANGAPEGQNVAWLGAYSSLSQTLTDPYGAVNLYYNYTLSFDVGQRADQGAISYAVQMWGGNILLAQNVNEVHPDAGQFLTSSVYYSTFSGNPPYGTPIEIRLVNLGSQQILFDDIRLVAVDPPPPSVPSVPEPASLVLMGTGTFALLFRRKR